MRAWVAPVLLVGAALVSGCDGTSATCDDLDSLQQQLDDSSPTDNDYYDLREKLNVAQADCNRS